MQIDRSRFLRMAVAVCIAGFAIGITSSLFSGGDRRPSSSGDFSRPSQGTQSVNSYSSLPCPSTDRFRALAAKFHFNIKEEDLNCRHPTYGKLGRIFLLMEKVKAKLPDRWTNASREPLENADLYLARSARTMDLADEQNSQQSFMAVNFFGNILIGRAFFDAPPLFGITALMHESRHSERSSQGHARCTKGDLPKAPGSCDERFNSDQNMGAYSLDVFYLFGLAEFGIELSRSDREYMQSFALIRLALYFNIIEPALALTYDLVFGLSSDGKLYVVHPFTHKALPVVVPSLGKNKIVRIAADPAVSGLLLYLSDTTVKSWTWGKELKDYSSDKSMDQKIRDAAAIYVKSEDMTFPTVLTQSNKILMRGYDPLAEDEIQPLVPQNGPTKFLSAFGTNSIDQKPLWREFMYQPDTAGLGASRLIMGLGGRSIILSDNGLVYGLETGERVKENAAFPRLDFNFQEKSQYWSFLYGGILRDQLYGITNNGKAYRAKVATEETSWTKPALQIEPLAWPENLLSVEEGSRFRLFLAKTGQWATQSFERAKISPFIQETVRFSHAAIVAQAAQTRAVTPLKTRTQIFAKKCDVKEPSSDPWFGFGMGVNSQGKRVFGFSPDTSSQRLECHEWNAGTRFQDLRWQADAANVSIIGANGSKSRVEPYSPNYSLNR